MKITIIKQSKFDHTISMILPIILLIGIVFVPLLPAQKASAATTIPAGCPGGPSGPATPGVKCPSAKETAEILATDKAKAYCAATFAGSGTKDRGERSHCETGYKASYLAKAVAKDDFCDKQATTSAYKNACKNGFDEGWREFKKENPEKISFAEADKRAVAFCGSKNRNDGKGYPKEAGSAEYSTYHTCVNGYRAALITDEVDFVSYCKGFDGDTLDHHLSAESCIVGFKQGLREYQLDHGIKNPATPSNNNQQGQDPGDKAPDGGSLTDCGNSWSNPLAWIICPIIDLGADLADSMFQNVISPLLSDVPISTNRNDPVYTAWQGFRLIANIMLVGSMLAIVYAQTKGGDS